MNLDQLFRSYTRLKQVRIEELEGFFIAANELVYNWAISDSDLWVLFVIMLFLGYRYCTDTSFGHPPVSTISRRPFLIFQLAW